MKLLLASLLLLCAGGCSQIGAIASKVTPAPTVPAEYAPPRKPLLVLVENYKNPGAVMVECERIGRMVADQLIQHHAVPVITPERLIELQSSVGEGYSQMKIPAIAEALGAEQVLYVSMNAYSADPALASDMVKGRVDVRVRMVDVKTAKTVWPSEESPGYPISVATQYEHIKDHAAELNMETKLCTQVSDKIAKLFYPHEQEEPEAGAEGDI